MLAVTVNINTIPLRHELPLSTRTGPWSTLEFAGCFSWITEKLLNVVRLVLWSEKGPGMFPLPDVNE